jgi:hypothetical protein
MYWLDRNLLVRVPRLQRKSGWTEGVTVKIWRLC